MAKEKESTIHTIATHLEKMPEQVEDAREAIDGWKHDLRRMVRKNPLRSVVGALAIGWIAAKVGRFL